jgi:hypothetical protein
MNRQVQNFLVSTATVFCISVSTADGVFSMPEISAGTAVSQVVSKDPTKINFEYVSSKNIPSNLHRSAEAKLDILVELQKEKALNADGVSVKSFSSLESFIQKSIDLFAVPPTTFTRPSGHPALYWGLGGERHITLSAIDNDLLLSIILPDSDTRIVASSNFENFQQLSRRINEYLG